MLIDAFSKGGESKTIVEAIDVKDKRQRWREVPDQANEGPAEGKNLRHSCRHEGEVQEACRHPEETSQRSKRSPEKALPRRSQNEVVR